MRITIRLEYGGIGMRAERSAVDYAGAWRQLAQMYTRHGIDVDGRDPMRGRVRATGTAVSARFIESGDR